MTNNDHDLLRELNLKKRNPVNIVNTLLGRELGLYSSNAFQALYSGHAHKNECTLENSLRRLYLAIYPNFTITNVRVSNCFLRHFSPDGRYLVGFNQNLNGIQIFAFKGSSAGLDDAHFNSASTLSDQHAAAAATTATESSPRVTSRIARLNMDRTDSDNLRHRAFDIYFKELANMRLVDVNNSNHHSGGSNYESMNRECALFYQDNHLIVASSELVNEENLPPYDQMVTNNEAIHFNIIENYTIYLVNLKEAKLCDKLTFKADKINLTHNQGLGLFKNMFVVLSQQNQTIYVYNIIPNYYLNFDLNRTSSSSSSSSSSAKSMRSTYKFVLVHQIGRFCMPDDAELFKNPTLFMQSMFADPGGPHCQNSAASKRPKLDTTTPESLNTLQASRQAPQASRSTGTSTSSSFNRQYNTRHFSNTTTSTTSTTQSPKGFGEACYTSMKQRILTFFYREALENNTLNQFYAFFNNIVNLKMYRMQLLDDSHLLIKYVNGEQLVNQKLNMAAVAAMNAAAAVMSGAAGAVRPSTSAAGNAGGNTFVLTGGQITSTLTNASNNNTNTNTNNSSSILGNFNISSATIPVMLNEHQLFYFVLYNMRTGKILNILRNTSSQLLYAYEHFQDHFSLSALDNWTSEYSIPFLNDSNGSRPPGGSSLNFHSLPSNNAYARQTMQRHIKTMSKMNSTSELAKSLLAQLPLSSQSYTTSPYLDHSLFSYDEKLISNFERPKPIGDQVIKFSSRESGHWLFRLYTGLHSQTAGAASQASSQAQSSKRLVAFIWHPREPFCISVQRTANEYYFNFHVYSKNHTV